MNTKKNILLTVVLLYSFFSLHAQEIAVIGAGYVGLVSGACFAQQEENHVYIVENNIKKTKVLLEGGIPFYEPGLDKLVHQGLNKKRLEFVQTIEQVCQKNPECLFICVGTPSDEDGSADLSYVHQAAKEIGKNLKSYCVIVDKSTVPVGTAEQVKQIINEELNKRHLSIPFDVVSNPEFLQEGSAVKNFMIPDRVVIGVENARSKEHLINLYKPFVKDPADIICMNIASAELTKYASNAMLATRISFMNQIARLADKVHADVDDVKKGMAKDSRIGPYFLNAGIGYGGSCFPKDVRALVHTGKEHDIEMSIVAEADRVNFEQRQWFAEKVISHYGDSLKAKNIGIWGLSFKPETDDIRYAPSIEVIKALLDQGAHITAYDPEGADNMQNIFGNSVTFAKTANEVLESCDCLVLLTEWKEFLKYQPSDFKKLKDGLIFDGRNCFDPNLMEREGIEYLSIGRNAEMKKN